MTVKELVKHLNAQDPEAEVRVYERGSVYDNGVLGLTPDVIAERDGRKIIKITVG